MASAAVTNDAEFALDRQLEIAHPDDTSTLDALSDPLREVADRWHAAGPVIEAEAWVEPGGKSIVEAAGVRIHNVMTLPAQLDAGAYVVTSYAGVRQVLTSPSFTSRVFEPTVREMWGGGLTALDPPEHGVDRAIMQRGFTPRRIKAYEDTIIRPIMQRRFAEFATSGRGDLVRDINARYPFEVVATIVGFDASIVGFVAACFHAIWQLGIDPEYALAGSRALQENARNLIDERRGQPSRDDLISGILEEELEGKTLPVQRLIGMINHFMAAGMDTTFRQSGSVAHTLLSHPEQFERLRIERRLIPLAVEECIRYEGIGTWLCRQAAEDTEIAGVSIPKDAIVFWGYGVVNRDPARWSDPHRFDIGRPPLAQAQFGAGAHTCIGQHLARFMLQRYVEHLLDDLPGLRFDPALPTPKITGWTQRAPLALPVMWDART